MRRTLAQELIETLLSQPARSGACPTRRQLFFTPLFAAVPVALAGTPAYAGKIDSFQTAITLPDAIKWVPWTGLPPHSGEMAALYGGLDLSGPYVVLMKWYPGYWSAPHSYATGSRWFYLARGW
jgi:hypothetical protein